MSDHSSNASFRSAEEEMNAHDRMDESHFPMVVHNGVARLNKPLVCIESLPYGTFQSEFILLQILLRASDRLTVSPAAILAFRVTYNINVGADGQPKLRNGKYSCNHSQEFFAVLNLAIGQERLGDERCTKYQENVGHFNGCFVLPSLRDSCSNCLWRHQPNECHFRTISLLQILS
jgi:hypothetical protein